MGTLRSLLAVSMWLTGSMFMIVSLTTLIVVLCVCVYVCVKVCSVRELLSPFFDLGRDYSLDCALF